MPNILSSTRSVAIEDCQLNTTYISPQLYVAVIKCKLCSTENLLVFVQ
jgi:hypothetical protein